MDGPEGAYEGVQEIDVLVSAVLRLCCGKVDELADSLGVDRTTVHGWAAGRRKPSRKHLRRLGTVVRRRGAEINSLAGVIFELARSTITKSEIRDWKSVREWLQETLETELPGDTIRDALDRMEKEYIGEVQDETDESK